jgi:transmembrane sensor
MEASDDQNLYARWLNNELTSEEQASLEASGEAAILRQIVAHTDRYHLPELDEQSYARIRARIDRKRAKAIPLYRRTSLLAAAGLALLVGLFWFYRTAGSPSEIVSAPATLAGTAGTVKSYTLPDNTGITLYGKSAVTYDKIAFGKRRMLHLNGEAFFDVRQKGAFTVVLPQGKIAVTGTRFNVLANDSLTSVRCFEGSVSVIVNGSTTVLLPGNGVRILQKTAPDAYTFDPGATTANATSRTVENLSLREVCASIALQYDVTFIPGDTDLDRSFTGTIDLSDLETALTLVFEPMQISWRKEGTRVFIENR